MTTKISFIVANDDYETFMKLVILGTTGAAMDIEINCFFTFWGLYLLKKGKKPKVSGVPGIMGGMAAKMFSKLMAKYGIEDPLEMLKDAVEDGNLKLYPCSMTLDLFGDVPIPSYKLKAEQLVDFAEEPVGAASFFEMSEGGSIISL
ncbi:MAG: DsrE/DsrF/DrsH-like family protein [Promethearchaeota archaeon]